MIKEKGSLSRGKLASDRWKKVSHLSSRASPPPLHSNPGLLPRTHPYEVSHLPPHPLALGPWPLAAARVPPRTYASSLVITLILSQSLMDSTQTIIRFRKNKIKSFHCYICFSKRFPNVSTRSSHFISSLSLSNLSSTKHYNKYIYIYSFHACSHWQS